MTKASKVRLWIIITAGVVLIVAAYFYLPSILGDTVYPLKYENFIVKYSKDYGVDPALVAAVIMQESRFNPSAVSGAGAQGLMQFMPGTASTMAREVGRTTYDIFDAETSVQFGAAHIRDLLLKYNGNVDAALAGYNAGTGNADRWIAAGLMDNVPFAETRNYIKNVKNYRTIYTSMYPDQLGITGTVYDTKFEQASKQEKATQTTFWSMFFKQAFGVVKPESSK
jgi:soluble lytic murein transglycosylase-like protein